MNKTLKELLPNFDPYSYYAGVTSAFAEVVGAGVKQLALSHPYTKAELEMMLAPSKQIAAAYEVVTFVEDNLLVTDLFPAEVAIGKFVILLAQNEAVLDRYHSLKNGTLKGEPLARAFGRLLSYDEDSISMLIAS